MQRGVLCITRVCVIKVRPDGDACDGSDVGDDRYGNAASIYS
jgi:hypothetical protein